MRRVAGFLLLILLAGCSERAGVRMGVKPFAEQELLAEIIESTLTEQGIPTRPHYACDDTFDCERSLQSGRVDVIVEYTGTALHLLGHEASASKDAAELMAQMNILYAPLQARWVAPLGFENGYTWLVEGRRAQAEGFGRMSDLGRIEGLRVACPPEYLRRPRDGLRATAERYGLRLAPEPVVLADPVKRYAALRDGKVDVAIGYTTDASTGEFGVAALEDDLRFFPAYHAAIVARKPALTEYPQLEPTLDRLAGAIDTDQMRAMNQAVLLDGEPIDVVASEFVHESGLVTEAQAHHRRLPIRVAVAGDGSRELYGPPALAAVRSVFADRPVRIVEATHPMGSLRDGAAPLAIVGAEDFFRLSRRGRLVRRRDAEAVAVLGRRVVHVLTRPGDSGGSGVPGRIGIVEGGKGERLSLALLAAVVREPAARAPLGGLARSVADGELDAALVVSEPGDPDIADALADGRLVLRRIDRWLESDARLDIPYLRATRIPAGSYPKQDAPIETLGAQVVLAGPLESAAAVNASGPAAALPTSGKPLPRARLEALAQAVGVDEAPDPAVPSMWALAPRGPASDETPAGIETALNVVVLGFLAWLFVVVVAPATTGGSRWSKPKAS